MVLDVDIAALFLVVLSGTNHGDVKVTRMRSKVVVDVVGRDRGGFATGVRAGASVGFISRRTKRECGRVGGK